MQDEGRLNADVSMDYEVEQMSYDDELARVVCFKRNASALPIALRCHDGNTIRTGRAR